MTMALWIVRLLTKPLTVTLLLALLIPLSTQQRLNAQVPYDTPDYGMDVETWWATHPFNPESSTYIPIGDIASPKPVVNVLHEFGGDIQAAIDALPRTGGTLYFDEGTYANAFQLVGKSNVHFVSPGGAILSGGPGWVVGCEEALNYSDIAAGVFSHNPQSIACVTSNRIQNIYFKNITFDGGGLALNAIELSAANGVVFDNVVFQNFYDPGNSHSGVVDGNVNLDNVWFRGAHFAGRERWALYLDGAHFSGVVQSRIDYDFALGGLLFLTNDDLNGDYNQNGIFEPNEKRNANYIAIAHNTFGLDGDASIQTAIMTAGSNILIKKNTVLRYVYRFALFAGKCDAVNPGVDMRFYNLKVIGNSTKNTDIFTEVDGVKDACDALNNTMGIGQYVVRDNVIDAPSLPSLVLETNPPIEAPNSTRNNCVSGKLYGTDVDCQDPIPGSSVFLPLVLSGP